MNKTITSITSALLLSAVMARSTIPVLDYSNLTQQIQMGLRQIAQYSTEVQGLQYQILQYKNQIVQATGLAPVAQIWQSAQGTLGQLTSTVNMFRSGAGVQGYLDNARDVNYWLASTPTSQTAAQSLGYWSGSQKTANQQLVQEIQQQEQQIAADAVTLQRLQTQAGSAIGTNQALTAANELAALQQKQLMDIRTLLISEQQALAAHYGAESTKQAMQEAADKDFLTSPYTFSDHQGWKP